MVRRDTVLYRLKSHSEKVALALALLAEGIDVSALERVTGIKEGTLRTWLPRAGMHAEKLNTRFFQELIYYGQVKKIVRRRRLVKVQYTMLLGEQQNLKDRWLSLGFSGRINTAFIERLNPTIRQGVSLLVCRTWERAKFSPELKLHLLWWRGYYHFARYHASLRVVFSQPVGRKGNQIPCRYRSRTPATLAAR